MTKLLRVHRHSPQAKRWERTNPDKIFSNAQLCCRRTQLPSAWFMIKLNDSCIQLFLGFMYCYCQIVQFICRTDALQLFLSCFTLVMHLYSTEWAGKTIGWISNINWTFTVTWHSPALSYSPLNWQSTSSAMECCSFKSNFFKSVILCNFLWGKLKLNTEGNRLSNAQRDCKMCSWHVIEWL